MSDGFAANSDSMIPQRGLLGNKTWRETQIDLEVYELNVDLIPRSGLVQSWLCWAQHKNDYIQLWHGDANLLLESLDAVQQTAAVILGGIARGISP